MRATPPQPKTLRPFALFFIARRTPADPGVKKMPPGRRKNDPWPKADR
jgi:hypothetical protein